MELIPLREQSKPWVRRLRSASLPGSLIRELFSSLLLLRWADYQEAEEEAMAIFDDRPPASVLPTALRWSRWYNLPPTDIKRLLGELTQYLSGLRAMSEKPLATYLTTLSVSLRRVAEIESSQFAEVVSWVAAQPFESRSDRRQLLEFFDRLITETTEAAEGQFVSPADIALLVAALTDPLPGDRIYDPCFGFGSFLTTAWQHATQDSQPPQSRNVPTVFGVEINPSVYVVGLTRLILAGVPDPRLECGNSLEREPAASEAKDGFDVVVANPPIGVRYGSEPWQYQQFPIPTKDSTGLFIQHALSQLRPHGRAALVVPEGFLFRGGPEQELRRYLIEAGHLEAVIGLPEGAFAPYTMVRGSIILLRKGSHPKRVHMMDASSFFEGGKGRKKATLFPEKARELIALTKSGIESNSFFVRTRESIALQRTSSPEEILPLAAASRVTPKNPTVTETESAWSIAPQELATLDWDLTPRRREKGGLLDLLTKLHDVLQGGGEIVSLANCVEIAAGRSFASPDLSDHIEGEHPAPYVRIKDIQAGVVSKGSSWVAEQALHKIDPRGRLLAGDLLLSKSGTIGKVGIVRNGAVGGIATNGLYVVRVDKNRLDPNFLLAYLASSECQNWLNSQSRGAVIQHLNRSALDHLPVPLPPLSIQERAALQYRDHGTDVIDFLGSVLGAESQDFIAAWLSDELKRLPAGLDVTSEPMYFLAVVESIMKSIKPVRNRAAHTEEYSPLKAWLLAIGQVSELLRNVTDVPRGPALLSVVQEASRKIFSAEAAIRGHLPLEGQARTLNSFLIGALEQVSNSLLTEVDFIFSPSASRLPIGETVEVSVWAQNNSSLPLRDVTFLTSPDWGISGAGFMAEGDSHVLFLRGESPKVAGSFSVTIEWAAKTLVGHEVSGERQVSFELVENTDNNPIEMEDLGGSPYVTGTPVFPNRNDVFFGREDLLEQIVRQVATSGNIGLLEGNRRAGKTSVLRHLEGTKAIPGWLGVYCSLQSGEGNDLSLGLPTAEVFRVMANSIAKALITLNIDTPLPNGAIIPAGKPPFGVGRACQEGISAASPFNDFREYLEVVLDVLETRKLGIVIMLDEFDKLQDGIDSGITSPQVPENIRFLVQSYPRLSAILTGSRRLKRMREEYWSALYGLGTRFGVSALDPSDARRLVTEPVKGKLTFSPEAVELAISTTARQPYLLQCLCNRIFDLAAQLKTRSITLDAVEQASAALVKDNEHFASLWGYAGSERRRLVLMLCSQRSGVSELLTFGELQELLLQRGVEVSSETLEADLAYLRELELIELVGKIGDGHYQLAIPLMGTWIEQQQDISVVMGNARTESEEENV